VAVLLRGLNVGVGFTSPRFYVFTVNSYTVDGCDFYSPFAWGFDPEAPVEIAYDNQENPSFALVKSDIPLVGALFELKTKDDWFSFYDSYEAFRPKLAEEDIIEKIHNPDGTVIENVVVRAGDVVNVRFTDQPFVQDYLNRV
jgi:hypothetical protein